MSNIITDHIYEPYIQVRYLYIVEIGIIINVHIFMAAIGMKLVIVKKAKKSEIYEPIKGIKKGSIFYKPSR